MLSKKFINEHTITILITATEPKKLHNICKADFITPGKERNHKECVELNNQNKRGSR